jgi:predicted DNA repair protein MutK
MPPRPVPTSNPTVRITMPLDVQLQAIQYMAAMQAPQPSDAAADPTYAKEIASALSAVGKTDVISSGRLIDIALSKGCDATLPKEVIARHTGASLTTLLAHGVLVVRCKDHELQCLQSTRDADDVLCTHK